MTEECILLFREIHSKSEAFKRLINRFWIIGKFNNKKIYSLFFIDSTITTTMKNFFFVQKWSQFWWYFSFVFIFFLWLWQQQRLNRWDIQRPGYESRRYKEIFFLCDIFVGKLVALAEMFAHSFTANLHVICVCLNLPLVLLSAAFKPIKKILKKAPLSSQLIFDKCFPTKQRSGIVRCLYSF